WEAFQARRCYATTGERIRLLFEVNGTAMGSELRTTGPPEIHFHIAGTKAIERVDLFRGIEILDSWPVAPQIAPQQDAVLLRVLWGGTERKGTARLQRVDWTGSLSVTGGTVELLEPVNFQSSDDAAVMSSETRIDWRNTSAGNAAGILIRLTGDDAADLVFDSGPIQFQVPLAEVRQHAHRVDAGGVGRFAMIGPPPDPAGPANFELETVDNEPLSGDFPYWIRVTQVDQSLAWSSPVYVTRTPE
ncbi:MAG: hypothetical protein VB858_17355, partial [Planctomycetaceae bacterium]